MNEQTQLKYCDVKRVLLKKYVSSARGLIHSRQTLFYIRDNACHEKNAFIS